jgi:hypothetical protein
MKTALTIPNPIFKELKQRAKELGMSFDEFCIKALAAFKPEYNYKNVTEALNEVYKTESSSIDHELKKIQALSLMEEKW